VTGAGKQALRAGGGGEVRESFRFPTRDVAAEVGDAVIAATLVDQFQIGVLAVVRGSSFAESPASCPVDPPPPSVFRHGMYPRSIE
jgi:hypothetical protein